MNLIKLDDLWEISLYWNYEFRMLNCINERIPIHCILTLKQSSFSSKRRFDFVSLGHHLELQFDKLQIVYLYWSLKWQRMLLFNANICISKNIFWSSITWNYFWHFWNKHFGKIIINLRGKILILLQVTLNINWSTLSAYKNIPII